MFIDCSHIFVKAGDGGAGCMSFRREAHVPRGGPDGGDGGRGGNVVVIADKTVSSLIEYRFKHHFKAGRGTHGKGSKMNGAHGDDLYLKVPVGTIIREFDDETKEVGELIADLTIDGEKVLVAGGGHGGLGNTHFVTPTRRAPAYAELGEPGEQCWIDFEMKLIADVALIGMPSVGKSSLIAKISAAKPKIADYPFTTLTPNLGVVSTEDHSFVVADIPGLIGGASEGKGLGHEFLRHIERTALLVHIVDVTGSYEGRDPIEDYNTINTELKLYAPELAERPMITVMNKVDMLDSAEIAELHERLAAIVNETALKRAPDEFSVDPLQTKIFEVSALTGAGTNALVHALAEEVFKIRSAGHAYEAIGAPSDGSRELSQYEKIWEYKRDQQDKQFHVKNLGGGVWNVSGKSIERMVIQTDWDNDEAIVYLQGRLKRAGVEKALGDAGAQEGDEIRILSRSFEYHK